MKNGFVELSANELEDVNGGCFVITGSMIVAGVTLIGAGYAAGSWLKHKIWG